MVRDVAALGQKVEQLKATIEQLKASCDAEADEVRQAKEAAGQAKEIARMQGIIDRFGAKATKASMAHSIEKRIDRLESTKVTAALNASAFPWGIVPGPVVVHIQRDVASSASPNQIWLDANLLGPGRL